ncbi:hypothetical protein [Marinoscillum pacificum]|uniref:hypothetical protein n=1 Tax=Marinoscillum pacificum TaxID=392723 RepID=UPI002157FBDE|nr:hypothetical protein [Marinoscillum pacificum]
MDLLNCLLLFISLLHSSSTGNDELVQLREGFRQAVVNQEVDAFYHQVTVNNSDESIIKAYTACAYAMKAKTTWNPFTKLSQVRMYEQLMTEAYLKSPDNIELRFLRFSIEYNLPSWLGMSDHLDEDQQYIASHTMDIQELMLHPEYARYILYFIKETGLYKEETVTKLQQALVKE